MQTLINILRKFRSELKISAENFSHAASIFNTKGKEQYLKLS